MTNKGGKTGGIRAAEEERDLEKGKAGGMKESEGEACE